ncbi:hypothetical protein BLNAU_3946 [Blattamonas nauphoetae]|uniref:Uncharacterized protein n=1 Tax=Blattamonas nauphoetae TaxID=2049346 RepID=A0ABQ9XL74_9EUKA|nr:hypothetical protein BLNAU_11808 [Blattamonas nauphoetae]KAK2954873.1 hypothetical protein BLNAU_10203 [Blattamonas nauphoetae]KAK2961178.1 hypothetical protein BLNAU_3946 [Blattamonas nauphoetae]
MVRETEASLKTCLGTCNNTFMTYQGNDEDPQTEDEEMSENEPDDSNCMSKCRLYNMPICITEAKAKELKQKARDDKKRMKARFNNLRKEEELQDATLYPLSFPTNLRSHTEQDEESLRQCEDEVLDSILDCGSHGASSASIEDFTTGKRLRMRMCAAQLARSPKLERRDCVQICETTRQQCFSTCTDKQKQVQGGFGFGVDEDEIGTDFELLNIIVAHSESQITQIKTQNPFDDLFTEDQSNHPVTKVHREGR